MNMNEVVGREDLLLLVIDSLRFDVARDAWERGLIPNLATRLPGGWEERHSPGNFTFAAHAAFFAGFLPTPARPGRHGRLFAVRFPGSETTTSDTFVFDAADIVGGLAGLAYHTLCIGGVGFFNKASPLGNVLPALFAESHWSAEMGVTHPDSTAHQVRKAVEVLAQLPAEKRVFLFMNLAAVHQPNRMYVAGATADDLATHRAALEYVDRQLPPLFEALERRGAGFGIVCSDHGTAYGEDGYLGHRVSHPVVWTVPYGEFRWEKAP